ncbi:MAG: ABC transporter permease, partial [Caldilineaceae bacterium]|nr:ABC transporter permease [Caldilineaceae bacterium]
AAGVVLMAVAAGFIAIASVLSLGSNTSSITKSARSTSDSGRTVFLRRALTTLQVACATALLTGAVLLGMSFRNLTNVEPGFRTSNLLLSQVDLPVNRYSRERSFAAKVDLLQRLESIPGVRSAALSSDRMLGGGSSAAFYAVDIPAATDDEREGRVYVHQVTSNFFETTGIPLLEGSTLPVFDGREVSMAEPDLPVVVSTALPDRFWPDGSAVGQRMKFGRSATERPWMRIVGVVGNTKYRGLPDNPTQDPDVYLPLAARATPYTSVVIHSDVAPLSLVSALTDAVLALDPSLSPYSTYAMDDRVAEMTASQRFLAQLSMTFGLVALLLAIVGTYGVVAYQVLLAQRSIGIRLALGAVPRQIFGNVMSGTTRFVGVGLVVGVGLAMYFARTISDQLFNPPDSNVPVIAAVATLVLLVACAAAWLPARRAMQVNPVSVLRAD